MKTETMIDRVSYAKLSSEILEAAGVLDHKELTVNLKKGNISIGKTENSKTSQFGN